MPVHLLEQAVKHKNDFGLIRLKVYSDSGEIVYSSKAQDAGNINQKDFFHKVLRKGEVHVNYVGRDSKSLEGELFPFDMIETYVPLMMGDRFLGAIEIYYDITVRKKQLDRLTFHSSAILFGLAAGLLFIIVITLIKENKTFIEHQKAEKALAWESDVNEALSE